MFFTPKDTPLKVKTTGKKIVRKITRPMSSNGINKSLFDPFSVEAETEKYDYMVPGASESKSVIESSYPKLQAFINSKNQHQSTSRVSITKPVMQYEQDIRMIPGASMMIKRNSNTLKNTPTVLSKKQSEIEAEEAEIAFTEEPIAYFSKHKDGHGHKFIYLNYAHDKTDPDFSPYDLTKTTASQLNQEYFIMSSNGVTHICLDGSTNSISLDRWANESFHFTSLRKLKFFSLYYLWKPFIQWKVYIMNMRFDSISKAIANTPFFFNIGFAKTQQQIIMNFVDHQKKAFIKDIIMKYLLAFKPQKQYIISDFKEVSTDNHTQLIDLYTKYVQLIKKQFLEFDSTVRDPKNIVVRDADIKSFKRKNPNLGQLMILEKKKAEKRVKRTNQVNEEVLRYGNYLRCIDYYLLEELAESVVSSFSLAFSYFQQKQSSIFQVEIVFTDDGNINLVPSLDDLKEAISREFYSSLSLINSLPRLIKLKEVRPHIKQSIPNFRALIGMGPNIISTLKPYKEIKETENKVLVIIEQSYAEALEAAQIFKELYPIYELKNTWKIEHFIKSNSDKPPLPIDYQLQDVDGFSDMDFEREPFIDLKGICEDVTRFLQYKNMINELVPCSVAGALFIESKILRKKLEPIPQEKIDLIFSKLKQLLSNKSTRIYLMLNSYKSKLQMLPASLDHYVALCKTIDRVKDFDHNIVSEIKYIDELFHTFVKYNISIEGANLLSGQSLHGIYQGFQNSLNVAITVKEDNIKKFSQELIPQATIIEDKINAYIEVIRKMPLSVELCNLEILTNTIETTKDKIEKLKPKVAKFIEYQKILHVDKTNFASLDRLIDIVGFCEKLYGCVATWNNLEISYIRNAFSLIDIDTMSDTIFTLENNTNDLTNSAPFPTALLENLINKIRSVSPYLKQLKLLSTPVMQPRHWAKLFEACKITNVYKANMRLDELITCGVLEFSAKIEEITDIAQREEKAESEFTVILKHWKSVNIPLLPNQPKVEDNLLIGDTSELLLDIENALLSLDRMLALPFAQGIEENVSELLKQLNDATNIINSWTGFQKNWSFLRSLFSNENAKSIQPSLVTKYSTVRRRWTTVVAHVYKDYSLLAVCTMPNLHNTIQKCNKTAISILSNLHSLANAKIKVFPRLFLLGTNDIITLAAAADIESIKKISAGLFMRCTSMVMGDANSIQRVKIRGIESPDGRQLVFPKHINVTGRLEHWLQRTVELMNQSLIDTVAFNVGKAQNNGLDWIYSVPLQVIYIVLMINFSNSVEDCLLSKTPQKMISSLITDVESEKDELINNIYTKNSSVERKTNNFVIVVLCNQLSILKTLSETNSPEIIWRMTPRAEYDQYNKKITVFVNGKPYNFGNEFWGKFRPLIFTESTNRIMRGMFQTDFPLIIGSTSTGRKTIIEEFAAIFGKIVYFCPAYSTISQFHLKQILSGSVMSEVWCIFKDINIMPESALITISDFIHTYKNSVTLNQNTMNFNSVQLSIQPNTRFMFLDEGNSSKLPDQLKNSLHRLVISKPDLCKVLTILLSAEGFMYPDSVASKLELATKSIGRILILYLKTPVSFGNAMKIVKIAGKMIVEARKNNHNFSISSKRTVEEFIVARAIFQFYSCIINSSIHPLLIKLIYEVFRSHDTLDLFSTLIKSSSRSKLDVTLSNLYTTVMNQFNTEKNVKEYLAQKAVDLYNLLLYNRCIIIHGETNTGKKLILDNLVKSIDIMSTTELNNKIGQMKRFKIHRIFHAAMQWDDTFGRPLNEGTPDEQWANGLTNMLFGALHERKDNFVHLVVFDGPLTPKFNEFIVELASSRFSKLHSLDSVDLGNDIKIIVVTDQISSFSPLMISCCSMLELNPLETLARSERKIESASLIKYKVFSKIVIERIGDIFDRIVFQITNYISKFSDLSFNKLVPNPEFISILIHEIYPEFTAKYVASYINSGDIGINEVGVTCATVIASSRFFDGILSPTYSLQFNTWLQSTFIVATDTTWIEKTIPDNFKLLVPRQVFYVFNPGYKQGNLIDVSSFNNVESAKTFDPKMSIVPLPSIIYNYESIHTLIKGKHDVCIIGNECGTIIRYFMSSIDKCFCCTFKINQKTTVSTLLYQILSYTKLQSNERSVLIFENLEEASNEVQEFIREVTITKTIHSFPTSSKYVSKALQLKNTNVIITTNSFDSLEKRLLTKFAIIFSRPITYDETLYIIKYLFLRSNVETMFTNKIVSFFNEIIRTVDGFPQSIRTLVEMTNAVMLFKGKKLTENNDLQSILKMLFSEIVLRSNGNKEQIANILHKYFPIFEVEQNLNFSQYFPRIHYYNNETGVPYTTYSTESTVMELDRLSDYIVQFNSVSAEKAPIYMSTKLLFSMNLIQRAIRFPTGHAILIGNEGTGRYSSAKIITNILKHDFIYLTENDMMSVMKEIINAAVVFKKKYVVYLRSNTLEITKPLQTLITFAKTSDFLIFFNNENIDDFFINSANTYKINSHNKQQISDAIITAIMNNIHIIISRKANAVPIDWEGAIKINFSDYDINDLKEITTREVLKLNNKKILGVFSSLFPKFLTTIHELTLSYDNCVNANNYFDFIRTFNTIIVKKYNESISFSNTKRKVTAFIEIANNKYIKMLKNLDSLKHPLNTNKIEMEMLEKAYKAKIDVVTTMDNKVNTQKTLKEQNLHDLNIKYKELKEIAKKTKEKILVYEKEIEALDERDIATIRICAEAPTYSFMKTFEVLCIFLNLPFTYNVGGVKLILDPNFLKTLHSGIKYDNIQQGVIKTVDEYFSDPEFTRSSVEETAPPVVSIYDWVLAIQNYAKAQKEYLTSYTQYINFERGFNEFIDEIKAEEVTIEQVRQTMGEDKKKLDEITEIYMKQNKEYKIEEERKDKCEFMLKETDWMLKKWKASNTNQNQISKNVIVESVLTSYYLAYCGQFPLKERKELVKMVTSEIVKIRLTEPTLQSYKMIKDSLMQEIGIDNSSRTQTFKMNTPKIHALMAPRIPLVLNTNGIFDMNINDTFSHGSIEIVSIYNTDFESILANCIANKKTIIITDVDSPNNIILRIASAFILRNDISSSKSITLNGKSIKLDESTHIIMETNAKEIKDVPIELRTRTTIINANDETERTIRNIINMKLVPIYEQQMIPSFTKSLFLRSQVRVSSVISEKSLIETFEELSNIAKDKSFLEAVNNPIVKKIDEQKTKLININGELSEITEIKKNAKFFTQKYNTLLTFIDIYWTAIKESLERIDNIHSISFQSFLSVLSNVLKIPGTKRETFNEEICSFINETLSKHILSWLFPMFSGREILVYMLTVAYYFNVMQGKSEAKQMNAIFDAIEKVRNSKFNCTKSDPFGDPITLLSTEVSQTNAFKLVTRALAPIFGTELINKIPVFQPESVLMQTPSVPCIIISPEGKSPIGPIMQYISSRSKNDVYENVSITSDLSSLKRARLIVNFSISKGSKIIVHCSQETQAVISFIADVCKTIQGATVNSNFRIIFSLSGFRTLPRFVLDISKRLYYDDTSLSMKHTMNSFFPNIISSIKMYSTAIPDIKKVIYAVALSITILLQRKFIVPDSFDEDIVFNENVLQQLMMSLKPIMNLSKDNIVYVVRDTLLNNVLLPQLVSPNDQDKVRAFVTKMFVQALTMENYFFVADDTETGNECLKFPNEIQLSTLSHIINSFPAFVPISGLQIDKSIAVPLRNWTLSRWIMEGIMNIQPKNTIESSALELLDAANKLSWSIPDILPLPSNLVAKTALGSIMRNEIISFNDLIYDMKLTLSSNELSPNLIDFVHHVIPDEWVDKAAYFEKGTTTDFITYLSGKRGILEDWISTRSISRIDLRFIKNATGLLYAYQLDAAATKGIPSDKAMLYFDLNNETEDHEITLINLKIIGGHIDKETNKLVVKKTEFPISNFQNLKVRVIKKTVFSTKLIPVPILKDPTPTRKNLQLTDGEINNIIWYVPLPTELNQNIIAENGVALLTQTPKCFTP